MENRKCVFFLCNASKYMWTELVEKLSIPNLTVKHELLFEVDTVCACADL